MDKFQLQIANIAVAGDIRNVVHRGIDSPITYPERMVLEFLHGKESVTEVRAVGEIERDSEVEFERLSRLYGKGLLAQLFPGAITNLPTFDRKAMEFAKAPRGVLPGREPQARLIAERSARAAMNEWDPADDEPVPFADEEPSTTPAARRKGKKTSEPETEHGVRGETHELPDELVPPEPLISAEDAFAAEETEPEETSAAKPKTKSKAKSAELDSKVE